jgi:signal transduction histidine kinase
MLLWTVSRNILLKHIEPQRHSRSLLLAAKQFQNYVDENNVSSGEWGEISGWSFDAGNVYIMHTSKDVKSDFGEKKPIEDIEHNREDKKSDGVQSHTNILYVDGYADTNFLLVPSKSTQIVLIFVAIVLSISLFIGLFYRVIKKKLEYILDLESGVAILESGELDYKMPLHGHDELARLAISINEMSTSLAQRIITETAALQSNKEIIGDLSHDIRTPLTILSGYIPLLLESSPLTAEQREYLSLVEKKTEQMRKRVDDLLEYATIYSGQQKINRVPLGANILIRQLVDELSPIFTVSVQNDVTEESMILGDLKLFTRLHDNLISNIRQHADAEKPVVINSAMEDETLHIKIENTIKASGVSTGKSLGLKISNYILECHCGEMRVETEGDRFITLLKIPIYRE